MALTDDEMGIGLISGKWQVHNNYKMKTVGRIRFSQLSYLPGLHCQAPGNNLLWAIRILAGG